ncbi:MAG: hypothetical protein AAGF04_05295 [Chlamydiota bacterium]
MKPPRECTETARVYARISDFQNITGLQMQPFVIDSSFDREVPLNMYTKEDSLIEIDAVIRNMKLETGGNPMLVVVVHVCAVALIYFALAPVSTPLALVVASIALGAPTIFFPSVYRLSDRDLQQAIDNLEQWKTQAFPSQSTVVLFQGKKPSEEDSRISHTDRAIIVDGTVKKLQDLFPNVSENAKERYCSKIFDRFSALGACELQEDRSPSRST